MKRVSTLLIVPVLALAACGGTSSGDGIASAGGAKGSTSASASAPSLSPDDARLKYAKCLREHGVNMPDDPKQIPKSGIEIPDSAMKACEKWQRAMGGRRIDMNDPATRDRFTSFARCMRQNGIDFPDPPNMPPPDFDGGNRPKFEKAMKACSQHLTAGE
jgi:hypothetical protein